MRRGRIGLLDSTIEGYDPTERIHRANQQTAARAGQVSQAFVDDVVNRREQLEDTHRNFEKYRNDISIHHQDELRGEIDTAQKQLQGMTIKDLKGPQGRVAARNLASQIKVLAEQSNKGLEAMNTMKAQFDEDPFIDGRAATQELFNHFSNFDNVRNGVDINELQQNINSKHFLKGAAFNDFLKNQGKHAVKLGDTDIEADNIVEGFDDNGKPIVRISTEQAAGLAKRFPQLVQMALKDINETKGELIDVNNSTGDEVSLESLGKSEDELVREYLEEELTGHVSTKFSKDPNFQLNLEYKRAQIDAAKARAAASRAQAARSKGSGGPAGSLIKKKAEVRNPETLQKINGEILPFQFEFKPDGKQGFQSEVYNGVMLQGDDIVLLKRDSSGELVVGEQDQTKVAEVLNSSELAKSLGDTNVLQATREALSGQTEIVNPSVNDLIDWAVSNSERGNHEEVLEKLKERGIDVSGIVKDDIYPWTITGGVSKEEAVEALKKKIGSDKPVKSEKEDTNTGGVY